MSDVINGYYDEYRSPAIAQALESFQSPARTWEQNVPKWHETADKMRCLGKWLIALATVLAFATITLSFTYPQGNTLILIASTGSAATIGTLVCAVIFHVKSYWNDPAYRQEVREEIMHTVIFSGYSEAKQAYGTYWNTQELITPEEIRTLIDQHAYQQKSYEQKLADKQNNITELMQDGIYPADAFKTQFQAEVAHLDIFQIHEKHGWQPFNDQRLAATPAYRQQAENKLQQSTFAVLVHVYGWELFSTNILSHDSPIVQKKVYEFLMYAPFIAIDYGNVKKYSLIPPAWQTKMEELHLRHEAAKIAHQGTEESARIKLQAEYTIGTEWIQFKKAHPLTI